jgi:oligosaccharide repeat unit polymerase
MAYLLIGNTIILSVLGFGVSRRLSLYSPLILSAVVWQVVFICGLAFRSSFYPLTGTAFVMWLVWFLVSSLFFLFLGNQPQTAVPEAPRRLPVDYTLILVVIILWLAWQVRAVGAAGPAQFFSNLRLSSNENNGLETLGVVGRFYPLIFALFLFEHIHARDANRRLRVLLWSLMLLFAVATMGKLTALTPIVGWAVIKGLRGRLPVRKLLVLVPAVFGLMIALQVVRALAGEQLVLSKFLGLYVYSPLVALGYMNTPPDAPFGAHVFRFAYALVEAAFGGRAPVQVVQPYVAVPFPTNVYTVIQPFAADFGHLGVFFGAVFYGLIFSLVYHLARSGRQLPLMIYAGPAMVLVGQFIGEFLFTMFSGQLQFVLAAVAVTALSTRATAEKGHPLGSSS